MGILKALGQSLGLVAPDMSGAGDPQRYRIGSPNAVHSLARIVGADVLGLAALPVTRETAEQIPAYAKGVGMITAAIAGAPLTLWDHETRAASPRWMTATDSDQSPQYRNAAWVRDLIDYGLTCARAERDAVGNVQALAYVDYINWDYAEDGRPAFRYGDRLEPAAPGEAVIIPGFKRGFVEAAARTVRGAIDIEEAWVARVQDPIPLTTFSQQEDIELSEENVNELLDGYVQARRSARGSVSWVPYGIKAEIFGEVEPQLFQDGRNAVTVDVARFLMLPSAALDATPHQASLTYSTQEGSRSQAHDAYAAWALPIEARLSLDDIAPPGMSVRLDMSASAATINPPISTPRED